jgi:hypothetical protein
VARLSHATEPNFVVIAGLKKGIIADSVDGYTSDVDGELTWQDHAVVA